MKSCQDELMRLWSVHPDYLDRQGLIACWREALLAQAVLAGRTTGYRNHPQLQRFRACPDPLDAVGHYLTHLAVEATTRGYRFDTGRIDSPGNVPLHLPVTTGQLRFEREHLLDKLRSRTPERLANLDGEDTPRPHPLFEPVEGAREAWERG